MSVRHRFEKASCRVDRSLTVTWCVDYELNWLQVTRQGSYDVVASAFGGDSSPGRPIANSYRAYTTSFLLKAISCPPNRIGVTMGLHLPSNNELTNLVNEVSSAGPDSCQLTRSRMCCGRTPSGLRLPNRPAGNESIADNTSASET